MKTTAIILLVLAGLMFGAFIGAVGGIYLQSRIDRAVKEAEIGKKDKEIKNLNDKLVNTAEVADSQRVEIDKKNKTIRELQRQATDKIFTSNISSEEFNATIRKQFEKGDFSAVERGFESLPPAFLRDFLKQNIGLSDDDLPKDDAKLGEFGVNLFKLLQGEQPKSTQGQAVEDISFALRVNRDNSPITPTTIFMPGDRRIYACFQNKGSLEGLAKVITRWTNKTTKEIIGFGPKPLNTASPYNFIWWEKREGWPAGEYLVELLSTNEFTLIGRGTFMIVGDEKKAETKEDKSDKPKDDKGSNDGKGKRLSDIAVVVQSIHIGTWMQYIAGRENKVIICEDASLKRQTCAHAFPVFYLAPENYDKIICGMIEKALLLRGYELIKGESVWEVSKIDKALVGKLPRYAALDAIGKIPSDKNDIIMFIQPMYLDVGVLTVELNKSKAETRKDFRPDVFFTPYPQDNKLVITGPAYLVRDYCMSIMACDQKGVLLSSQKIPFDFQSKEPATKIKYPYPVVFDVANLKDLMEEFNDMGIKDIPTDVNKVTEYLIQFFKAVSVGAEEKKEEPEKDK